jgi:predicted flap endonuclease-1-like 5' DNA nuclease
MFNKNNPLMRLQGEMLIFAGFAGLFQVTEGASNTPWWLIIIITVVVVLLLFAPELRGRGQAKSASTTSAGAAEPDIATAGEAAPVAQEEAGAAASATAEAAPSKPDNLTRIEGIGPKIAGLLQEANIATFDQLAAAEVSRLEEILEAADLHMIDPTTWPEQASLAASGEWETLQALQDLLKGGRRA